MKGQHKTFIPDKFKRWETKSVLGTSNLTLIHLLSFIRERIKVALTASA